MNNIQIKTKVITNRILEEVRSLTGKTIHAGLVADTVRDYLADEDRLDACARVQWDEENKEGVCAFTPEQLLELAPHGFNPCPIERFVSGELDLDSAIGFCFQTTFSEAWADESWETSAGTAEIDYDLFQVTYGDRTEDQWLATDKEGNPLRDICPECRAKEGQPDLKVVKN